MKHEEALRQMLLNGDPGDESVYPVLCAVLWLPDGRTEKWYIVVMPRWRSFRSGYEHHFVYRFTFGGAMWGLLVGRHEAFGKITIRKDGTVRVGSQALHQLGEFRQFLNDHERSARRRPAKRRSGELARGNANAMVFVSRLTKFVVRAGEV